MGALLELLFPPRCPACGRTGWPMCRRCADRAPVVTPPICARCGRPVEEPLASCGDCPPRPIDAARSPFLYEGPVAGVVRALKFRGWRALGPALAGAMVEAAEGLDMAGATVTWVPLASRRRAARGFDQAEAIARPFADLCGLPVRQLLRRVLQTRPQATRSGRERRAWSKGSFEVVAPVPGAVVLVDDVVTTGATAAACAEALLGAGAGRIVLVAAARSIGGPVPARCYGVGVRDTAV